jgi:hypothetical protein
VQVADGRQVGRSFQHPEQAVQDDPRDSYIQTG